MPPAEVTARPPDSGDGPVRRVEPSGADGPSTGVRFQGMTLAPPAAALALVVVLPGCGPKLACPGFCPGPGPAQFNLACAPTDLASVVLSGSCATDADASPANYVQGGNLSYLFINGTSTGTCHVELTFASGFTYSADVEFVPEQSENGCPVCSPYTATVGTFSVNNPSTTCVDAGGVRMDGGPAG
jgi:hypothetical protein